jgi:predicted alpha/beta-hydrolase family hydrolase
MASGSSRKIFVFAHGAGAGERHPFMVAVARGLAERGIDVVPFEFPYMRQKRKAPDKAPVLEAAFREAIDDARARVTPDHALFIGGKSMGGRMATHLAAQWAEPKVGLQLHGVIALGYPLHPPGKPAQLRVAHLPSITVPMLIVQGARDTFGTPEELRPILKPLSARVTLHVVDEGDHSLAVRRRTDYSAVADTVASWIQGT